MADPLTFAPHSDYVAQATGMVSVQACCTLAQAFDLLRERAFRINETLERLSFDVIDRLIRFNP